MPSKRLSTCRETKPATGVGCPQRGRRVRCSARAAHLSNRPAQIDAASPRPGRIIDRAGIDIRDIGRWHQPRCIMSSMSRPRPSTVRIAATTTAVGAALAILTGCGATGLASTPVNADPAGASSSRAAVTAFLHALEQRNAVGMRQLMTPGAQSNEANPTWGMLRKPPKLTAFSIRGFDRENPRTNASPPGSLASLRYTVALTPASGFDDDDTNGSHYEILVSETPGNGWMVAELGGCC
jgi:hypothetical protein